MPNYPCIIQNILRKSETMRSGNPGAKHYCGVLIGSNIVTCRMNHEGGHAEVEALRSCIKSPLLQGEEGT